MHCTSSFYDNLSSRFYNDLRSCFHDNHRSSFHNNHKSSFHYNFNSIIYFYCYFICFFNVFPTFNHHSVCLPIHIDRLSNINFNRFFHVYFKVEHDYNYWILCVFNLRWIYLYYSGIFLFT